MQINDFIASQTIVKPNQPIVFSWLVSGAKDSALSCKLDVDGDGITDYTITNCEATTSQEHVFKAAGYYTARLTATNNMNISVNKTQAITATNATSVTIAAVGDIACDPTSEYFDYSKSVDRYCRMGNLANSIKEITPAAFLPLGDNQYEDGALWKFEESYDIYFGQFKSITYPIVGNHEYITPNATGYFQYFGKAAGNPSKGYYSYDLGNWHLIALNSNCLQIGGCEANSQQEKWLRRDLAENSTACTLAYWHHPRFSSGMHKNDTSYVDFWGALYDAQAEVVLVGHDHHYERFAPVNSNGDLDESLGIREFVVGSGGKSHTGLTKIHPNSEVRNKEDYGFLRLDLHPQSYDWQFISEDGAVLDSGNDDCHF